MGWIAIRMLTGDRVKFFGLLFGVAFSALLIAQQATVFTGLMLRASSAVWDVTDADIWVMDPKAQQVEGTLPLPSTDLLRVRGVRGVAWAVPMLRAGASVRTNEGRLEAVTIVGVDDVSLVGLPQQMLVGNKAALASPDSILVDGIGIEKLYPGETETVGRNLELNDRRAVIAGIVDAKPSFATGVLFFTRYSNALNFVPGTRNRMTYVLAKAAPGEDAAEVARRITATTGLKARTQQEFALDSINYTIANTGIPINFGITVVLGFVVGAAIVGLTFSLFIRDNIRQFGALKAIGVTNGGIRTMVALQAAVIGSIGFGLGIGMATLSIAASSGTAAFKGFYTPWQIVAGVAVTIAVMVFGTGWVALRKVLQTEPAEVFR
jgi:putative ABC transport system permease protein